MAKRNQKTRQQTKPRQTPPKKVEKKIEFIEGKFWFGNIHIHGVGVVNGQVRSDHLEKFRDQHKKLSQRSGLPVEDQPPLREDYWIRNVDELELKKKRDRKPKQDK